MAESLLLAYRLGSPSHKVVLLPRIAHCCAALEFHGDQQPLIVSAVQPQRDAFDQQKLGQSQDGGLPMHSWQPRSIKAVVINPQTFTGHLYAKISMLH
jgi:hypothetical protein